MGAAKHVSRSGGNTVSRDVGRSPGGQWAPSPGRQTPARHRRPCERGAEGGEGRARPRPSRGCRGAAPTAPFLLGRTAVPAPCPTPGSPHRALGAPAVLRGFHEEPQQGRGCGGSASLARGREGCRTVLRLPGPGVPPQSDAGLGWSRSRRGPCGPHGGASGVPSVPAAEAAGPRATVLGPPLAGRSRLTHTEQVCCQRAFQVSTWRPFPRRGRGRPATPPSVSPQTRGAGRRATRTARATRDREKAGGVAPAGPAMARKLAALCCCAT